MPSFDLLHGRCALVDLDPAAADAWLAALPDADRARAAHRTGTRRAEAIAGRTALRRALLDLGGDGAAPIDTDDRGAPVLPAGWVGSISHKGSRAAALVARDTGARIGVDLERAAPPRLDIGARILTPREHAALAGLAPRAYGRAVTLRFAIKEAIYKAVDPFVRRYVGFVEVELAVGDDGTCAVTVLDAPRLPVTVAATWREVDGHWLATARATPAVS